MLFAGIKASVCLMCDILVLMDHRIYEFGLMLQSKRTPVEVQVEGKNVISLKENNCTLT